MIPTVAIVGRPNVGKSTLFNRLVGRRLALVDDQPGVTRDRREGPAQLFDLRFTAIDTAGLDEADDASLEARMQAQTDRAVAEADLVLLLIDARTGVTPLDEHFAARLRRGPAPVVLVANKCEGALGEAGRLEAFALGLGEAIPISAEHGLGLSDLHDAMREKLGPPEAAEATVSEEAAEAPHEEGPLRLAVVGRPNVGKSTLVNVLIGEERLLTGPEAGITRDAIALDWAYDGRPVRLVDTAGLRRRARTTGKIEKLSAADALRAIKLAEVVVLMIDAEAPLEKQDLTIARLCVEEGRALVLALNKWDLCADPRATLKAVEDRLQRSLPQTRGIPVVPVSALRRRGLDRLMAAVFAAHEVWNRRIPTAALNRWLAGTTEAHPPPAPGGRRIRLRYMTQARTRPPTFALFCSRPEALPDSYLRYLENALREDFDLPGTPIRIHLRKGENPYDKR
ncbi:MAG TPA: ribosome biogenesis GTPase Der, partial [Kiloniellales bacterium]|nr:ribosome biogenesis GTPase Der [Kiloniellales bacterium]